MNKLIVGNLVHRPLRSIISAFAVAIEVVMILSIAAIMYGMRVSLLVGFFSVLISVFLGVAAGLAGCSSEMDDLKQFVRESDKNLPRRIDPLPAVKPFEGFQQPATAR